MLSIISLVAYVVTKIAVGIFAGGIVFSVLLPEMQVGPFDSFWLGSILVLLVTGIYTTLGGFRAVAYTESVQTVILIVGSALVTYYGLEAIGGWGELKATIGGDKFNLWKPLVPAGIEGTWDPVEVVNESGDIIKKAWYFGFPGHYPWLGMLFCAPIIGLWYWCTDQTIVQRVLGAKTQRDAQLGPVFAGFLKLLPVFFMVLPGVLGYVLFKDIIGSDNDLTLPVMIQQLLPTGVIGIVTAGLLAALMSTIAGALNSSATLVAVDIVKRIWPQTKDRTQVTGSRFGGGGFLNTVPTIDSITL